MENKEKEIMILALPLLEILLAYFMENENQKDNVISVKEELMRVSEQDMKELDAKWQVRFDKINSLLDMVHEARRKAESVALRLKKRLDQLEDSKNNPIEDLEE